MKRNWQERNVYSFGRCYKGCYSQDLYWLNMNWYKRMYRTWYKLASFEPFETVEVKHRLTHYSQYHFKDFKEHLR